MMDPFLAYLKQSYNFSQEDLESLNGAYQHKKIKKKQFLLQEGEICDAIFFVVKGLLRLYAFDEDGNEFILRFAKENSWLSDCASFYSKNESQMNIDAIENTEVILFKREAVNSLTDKVPGIAKMVALLNRESAISYQNYIYESITSNSSKKYDSFLKKQGDIALRIPQSMIASYLGIKPETLSRIRQKMGNY